MITNKIRVLMVMDSLAVGGTETYVLSLVKALQQVDVVPIYVGANGAMYNEFILAGCPVHFVHYNYSSKYSTPQCNLPPFIYSLQQIMKHRNINIVHVHQTLSGIYAAIAAKQLGIPVIFTAHGTYYPNDQLQLIYRYSDAIISVSRPVQSYLQQAHIQSYLIPNGINIKQFYPSNVSHLRTTLNIPENAMTVVYVSRLCWDKANVCKLLIMASYKLFIESVSHLRVVIVGEGDEFEPIKQFVHTVHQEIGQSFIHMVGSQKKVNDYLNLANIVVGTGRVALEAMACKKPVLAIGNHGFLGMIKPETYKQAWECYFGDHHSKRKPSKQLIAAVLRSALSDQKYLATIGEYGYKWVTSCFNIDDLIPRIVNVYQQFHHRI